MERDGGRTRAGMVEGVGCVEGKMERRLGAGAGVTALGGVVFLLRAAADPGPGGLCGILSSWTRLTGLVGVSPSTATCAVRVEILGNGVSGSEESGLDWLFLDCICLLLCHEPVVAEPEGMIFRGRGGCEVLRLAVFGEELRADVRKAGAELMRCICLSTGNGCILELRFPVDNFVVQCEDEGRSPTKDCGLSPFSEIGGGGTILESCLELVSVSSGMLCLELRTLPRGAIGGNAVMVEVLQPMTGESSPRSSSLGDDILVLIVRSIPAPDEICGEGIADLRLVEPVPYDDKFLYGPRGPYTSLGLSKLCLLGACSLVSEFVREVQPVTLVLVDIRTLLRRLFNLRWSTDCAIDELTESASEGLRPRVDSGFV